MIKGIYKGIRVILFASLFFLSGCASQPNLDEIQTIPVIQLGDSIPANGEYILYLPEGKDIETTVNIDGNILQRKVSQVIKVKLQRDIYSYKQWLSYDKKNWLNAQDALNIRMELKLPSYDYPHTGKINLHLSGK